METKLEVIERHLQDIRCDVAELLQTVQHELEAVREREFWREYRENYQDE